LILFANRKQKRSCFICKKPAALFKDLIHYPKFKKMKRFNLLLILLLVSSLSSFAQHYKVANKFPVAGEGGWDYLVSDPESGRLFVSHGSVVNVVDEKTGALLGTIPDTKGVHGIALANDLGKGFISNGRDSSVTVFDLKTLATITKVQVTGINPDAILYDPFSHKVFAFNGRTKNVTVIDGKDNKVVGTIALDGKPEFAVSNEKGRVYVNIEDKNKVTVINATTLKVEANWPITPGEEASGLAIDLKGNRLFAVCDNKMMVILDAENGKIIATPAIGEGPDAAGFDPELHRAYSSNGEGSISVIQEVSPNEFKLLETVPTQKGARTMALDTKTHHIYLSAAEYGGKPEATKENPHPRPAIKAGSFVIIDVATN
jgi:DNA-binding beta-propeller fold protein YncE